jgi:hypothetical protein
MIAWIAHVFCDRCNGDRMQGADRGYLHTTDQDAEGLAYATWWRRRRRLPGDAARPLVCPECVAEMRAEIAAAVALPLFDEVRA